MTHVTPGRVTLKLSLRLVLHWVLPTKALEGPPTATAGEVTLDVLKMMGIYWIESTSTNVPYGRCDDFLLSSHNSERIGTVVMTCINTPSEKWMGICHKLLSRLRFHSVTPSQYCRGTPSSILPLSTLTQVILPSTQVFSACDVRK